jgi:hypothetical protein
MNVSALQRKTSRLVLEMQTQLPQEKDQGFIFEREHFTAQEYKRIEILLAEVRPLYQWYSNGWVNHSALSEDQKDQLMLWAMLQEERLLQHKDHAAIVSTWLNTPWKEQAARLLALEQKYGKLPDEPRYYSFTLPLSDIKRGLEHRINTNYRHKILYYLFQHEQGVSFVPCIDKSPLSQG